MSVISTYILDPSFNAVTRILTLGLLGMEVNPEFLELNRKSEGKPKSFADNLYDSTTLLIIDDSEHRLVPRYRFRQ